MTLARVIRLHGAGGPDVMRIDEIDVPRPGAGEVRLRMRAIGVTRGDILYRKGGFPDQPPLPSTFGFEGSGEVESIGPGVHGFEIGDPVSIIPLPTGHYGSYGKLVTIAAERISHHPPQMSFVKAVALWSSYLTAFNCLVYDGHLSEGETFVLTAGSSAVGIAAVQIGRMLGATPIAITRTPEKRDAILALGAEYVIVSQQEPDVAARIMMLTGGKGVRFVADAAAGPMLEALTDVLSYEGILACYGMLDLRQVDFPLMNILVKGLTVKGSLMTHTVADPVRYAKAKAFIYKGVAEGILDPPICATFSFEDMAKAHDLVETNALVGKVVVEVNS